MKVDVLALARSAGYWVVVLLFCWTVIFYATWTTGHHKGEEWMQRMNEWYYNFDPTLVSSPGIIISGMTGPILLMATLSSFLVTRTALNPNRTSWVTKIFNRIPLFFSSSTTAKNQFSAGDMDFNLVGFLLAMIGTTIFILGFMLTFYAGQGYPMVQNLSATSIFFGFGSLTCLSFFLIPVARHSAVLAAMGWNPIHAMRIHIVCGYLSFWFAMVHGITYVVVWFKEKEEHGHSVWDQVIPNKECWKWHQNWETYYLVNDGHCSHEMFSFTGIVAGVVFIILTVSSLNYFRRRWYRVFYLFHIFGAVAFLIAVVWHWSPAIIFLAPSLCIYFATTSPTLMHAMLNYFSGGNKIVSARILPDAGGCCELIIAITSDAAKSLRTETNQFIKMCVPTISMIWHPFTVIAHPQDKTSFRILLRPIGPFTKELVRSVTSPDRPAVLVDAFYRGDNLAVRADYAHDHVTIVCGGITITPFLTMVPVLLSKLAESAVNGTLKVKTVAFHWSVREQGLLEYIQENHLNFMMRQAQKVVDSHPEFCFHLMIYKTGNALKGKSIDITFDASKGSDSSEVGTPTGSHDSRDGMEEGDGGEKPVDEAEPVDEEKKQDVASTENIAVAGENASNMECSGSFAVDNGRLMPGRYEKIWQNLPAWTVVTVLSWMFFYIGWRFYWHRANGYPGFNESPADRNQAATHIWGLLVIFAVQIPAGILVELIYEMGERWIGLPRLTKSFEDVPRGFGQSNKTIGAIHKSGQSTEELPDEDVQEPEASEEQEDLPFVEEGSQRVTSELIIGRPTMEQIFESCRQEGVGEPGIFLCAPVQLMESVKKEASKENKAYLLQTRYVLYEEPFEF